MAELTARQRDVLNALTAIIDEQGYPPSVRQLGERCGLKSASTVHMHLSSLVERGFIVREPNLPRAIKVIREDMDRDIVIRLPETQA